MYGQHKMYLAHFICQVLSDEAFFLPWSVAIYSCSDGKDDKITRRDCELCAAKFWRENVMNRVRQQEVELFRNVQLHATAAS